MADVTRSRARYNRILRFALRAMLQTWWFEILLPKVGLRAFVARGRAARFRRIARRFHGLAVSLGGLMIKVGQFLSSRLDVLPPEVTTELEGLQDEVPAESFAAIGALAEAELGAPLGLAFARFEETPVAAASLGQAHRARLAPADAADAGFADVVVKVQRPGIEQIVAVDLAALRRVAGWLDRVRFIAAHVDLPALVEEFAATSRQEIDYVHEAVNAERFAEDFAGDVRVRAPRIAWERTTRRVLILEDVTAIKINDLDALRAAGIEPADVAPVFAAAMLDQLFGNGYFHADPHPGNLFITPATDPAGDGPAWHLTFVDFGMMGEVPERLRRGLRQFLLAVAARDGRRLVAAIRDMDVVLPAADTVALERAMTELFARFGGMGVKELQGVDEREFRAFASEFGETVRGLPFQFPENFLLIVRAVSLTSGMCSALDPDFNMWDAVEPYAGRLLREERGNVAQAFARDAVSSLGVAAGLPRRLDELATRLERGEIAVATPRLDQRVARLERMGRRIVSAVLFAGLFTGGILLRDDDVVLGTVVLLASAPPFLHAVLADWAARRGPG